MGKCFVTKLKGVVENATIPKVGELIIGLNDTTSSALFSFLSQSSTMSTKGNITITNRDNSNVVEAPVSDGNYTLNGTGYLCISNKYGLYNLLFPVGKGKFFDFSTLDLDSLSFCKDLEKITIQGDSLMGNLNVLENCSIKEMELSSDNIYGKLSPFLTKEGVSKVVVNSSKITETVDLSKCAKSMTYFYSQYAKGSWKSERSSDAYIISLPFIGLGEDLDAMLINQAKCKASTNGNKLISASGIRTASSNEAISTLQSKGYTVSVSGITG